MVFDPSNYFDVYDIFVNQIFGSLNLFIIVLLVVIWFLIAKFNLPVEIGVLLTILFLSVIIIQTFNVLIWVFVVLIVGLIFFTQISKIFER
jgi:hypothetical protein